MLTEKFVRYIVREKIKKYLCFHSGKTEILPPRPQNKAPLMLYVHIPFCEKLCTYCSFHRVPFQEKIAREYFAALRREIKLYKQAGYDFQAAYIGGGTPTVLIDELAKTIRLIRQSFQVTEISVETNPNHLEPKRMKVLQEVGVDRLSVGVQSFDDTILKAIGRYEQYGSGQEIFAKIKAYRQWFKTINIDMIFNFPTQTEAMLQQDLDLIRQLGISQVTFYPLMIATTTQKNMEKTLGVVQPRRGKELYEIIRKTMEQDYQASTALCFSKNDSMIDEYVVNYDEYVGVGSGAFGYVDGTVYANCFDIPQYIQRVNQKKFPIMAYRNFESRSTLLYDFMMEFFGQTINLPQLRAKHGFWTTLYLYPILFFFWSIGAIKQGRSGSFIACKPYYGVIMMREFFTGVNNFRDFCRAKVNQSLTSTSPALLTNQADNRQAI